MKKKKLPLIPRLKKNILRLGRFFSKPQHVDVKGRGARAGDDFAAGYRQSQSETVPGEQPEATQFLEDYFDANTKGPGIWKWRHYFPIYQRHFAKFRGRPINICEIGVYSGGSLGMWQSFFGPDCKIFGVDIEEACKVYESDKVKILIGDQADRNFWRSTLKDLPPIDILIDDGGHTPEQQITTLEEVLPHLRMGGVYLCEDVVGQNNEYAAYTHALADALNAAHWAESPPEVNGGGCCHSGPLQRYIESIHFYPFVTVIEKLDGELEKLMAPKHGTEWQPFKF